MDNLVNLPKVEEQAKDTLVRGLQNLSPGQRQVLDQWLTGATSKESARILNLSPRTVEATRRVVIQKLGVKNIIHGVAMLVSVEVENRERGRAAL